MASRYEDGHLKYFTNHGARNKPYDADKFTTRSPVVGSQERSHDTSFDTSSQMSTIDYIKKGVPTRPSESVSRLASRMTHDSMAAYRQ